VKSGLNALEQQEPLSFHAQAFPLSRPHAINHRGKAKIMMPETTASQKRTGAVPVLAMLGADLSDHKYYAAKQPARKEGHISRK